MKINTVSKEFLTNRHIIIGFNSVPSAILSEVLSIFANFYRASAELQAL